MQTIAQIAAIPMPEFITVEHERVRSIDSALDVISVKHKKIVDAIRWCRAWEETYPADVVVMRGVLDILERAEK